jgi:hypothetical protein
MAPYMKGIGYLASFVYQDRTGNLEFISEFYQSLLFFFDGYSIYNYVCIPRLLVEFGQRRRLLLTNWSSCIKKV